MGVRWRRQRPVRQRPGIGTDSASGVYVADTFNDRTQKFTSTGGFITTWGSSGSGNGQFSAPRGVATDPAGYVYVVEFNNHRIQKFKPVP